jgi:hypothetical protein
MTGGSPMPAPTAYTDIDERPYRRGLVSATCVNPYAHGESPQRRWGSMHLLQRVASFVTVDGVGCGVVASRCVRDVAGALC